MDAEHFLELNGTDMQRQDWIDPALRRTRFDEWADAWWETTIKLAPSHPTRLRTQRDVTHNLVPMHNSERTERSLGVELRAPAHCGRTDHVDDV